MVKKKEKSYLSIKNPLIFFVLGLLTFFLISKSDIYLDKLKLISTPEVKNQTEEKGQGYKCNFMEIDDKESMPIEISYKSSDSDKQELPDTLKDFLIQQNPCKEKQNWEDSDFEFDSKAIDLNDDGEKEYIVMPWLICGEMVRGVPGNGEILVVRNNNNQWEIISTFYTSNAYYITKEKTNGFYNILTHYHYSAYSGTETLWKWKEKNYLGNPRYEDIFTKWYRFDVSSGQ